MNSKYFGTRSDTDFKKTLQKYKQSASAKEVAIKDCITEAPPPLKSVCPICLENCNEMATAIDGCQHIFCHDCIISWSEISISCPLCKKAMTKIKNLKTLVQTIIKPIVHEDILNSNDDYDIGDYGYDYGEGLYGYESDGFVVSDNVTEYEEYDTRFDIHDSITVIEHKSNRERKRKREGYLNQDSVDERIDISSFSYSS